jgi:uncharacterized membrane protein YbhN (UPF0104 family)
MKSLPPRSKRWLLLGVKLSLVAIVLWGIHRTAYSGLAELERQHWSPASLRPGWLVLSGALYLLALLPSGVFWYRLLRVLGQEPHLAETLRAYYIGHLGKYVPGKALVVILRTGLIRSHRVNTTTAAVSVFYETLTMMAVGAFVAGAILLAAFRHQTLLMLVAGGLMLVAGLPTLPPVFRRLVKLTGAGRADPVAAEKLVHLRTSMLARNWLSIAAGWCLCGLSLWATLVGCGYGHWPASGEEIALCIAASALAVVAGFLSLIPGGALVREAVLFELLQPTFGEAGALVSALLARLVWLVAELLISGILYSLGSSRSPQGGPAASVEPSPRG